MDANWIRTAERIAFWIVAFAVFAAAIAVLAVILASPSHAAEVLLPREEVSVVRVLAVTETPTSLPVARVSVPRWRGRLATPAPTLKDEGSCTATYFSGEQGYWGPLRGMFAAHLTWPGGTKVRVSANGRSVVVTILDKGPAAWTGHCLDLAPAAFSQLAPLSQGVVSVSYEVTN